MNHYVNFLYRKTCGTNRQNTQQTTNRYSGCAPLTETGAQPKQQIHFVLTLASSKIRLARDGLNTPQEQNRCKYVTAWSGVRRPSFTQSIIFFANEFATIPWPHIVESSSTWVFGSFS